MHVVVSSATEDGYSWHNDWSKLDRHDEGANNTTEHGGILPTMSEHVTFTAVFTSNEDPSELTHTIQWVHKSNQDSLLQYLLENVQ